MIWRERQFPLTPPDDGVPVEVSSLGKERLHEQREEIQTFDEQPEVVGHDTVVEENHHCFTRHLRRETQTDAIVRPRMSHCSRYQLLVTSAICSVVEKKRG